MKSLFLITGTTVIVLAVSVLTSLMILNETTRMVVASWICVGLAVLMFIIFGIQAEDREDSPVAIPLSVLIAGAMAILLSLGVQLIHMVVGFLILAVIVVGGVFLLMVSSARKEDIGGIKETIASSLVIFGWFVLTLVNFGIIYYIPRLI